MEKYIENLAVAKFFDQSNDSLIHNDVIDYIRSLKIRASSYQRMRASIRACDRLGDPIGMSDYTSFREAMHLLFG